MTLFLEETKAGVKFDNKSYFNLPEKVQLKALIQNQNWSGNRKDGGCLVGNMKKLTCKPKRRN